MELEKIIHNRAVQNFDRSKSLYSACIRSRARWCVFRVLFSRVQIGSKTSHGVRRAFSGTCSREKPRPAARRFKSITLLGSLVCDMKNLLTHTYTHKAGNWSCFSCGPRRRGRYEFRESSSHNNSL
jgi:hypothetical protein